MNSIEQAEELLPEVIEELHEEGSNAELLEKIYANTRALVDELKAANKVIDIANSAFEGYISLHIAPHEKIGRMEALGESLAEYAKQTLKETS